MTNRTLVAALILAGRQALPEAERGNDHDLIWDAMELSSVLLRECCEDPNADFHVYTYTYTKQEA